MTKIPHFPPSLLKIRGIHKYPPISLI
jgi:hypothetical protein